MNVHLMSTVEERFNFISYWIFIIDYLFYNNMFPDFRKLHGMCSECAVLKMENKNSLMCAAKTKIKQSKQTEKAPPLSNFLLSFHGTDIFSSYGLGITNWGFRKCMEPWTRVTYSQPES